jgi:uncharacterized protein (DUF952 family)
MQCARTGVVIRPSSFIFYLLPFTFYLMNTIYHLAPAARWQNWPTGAPYLPAEYEADGFIHCTAGDELMLRVANTFYRAAPGDFALLVIDTARLTSPLKWEEPVGDPLAPQFPHIYGSINREAIVEVRAVHRAGDGTFVGFSPSKV